MSCIKELKNIEFQRISEKAVSPFYATEGAAAADVCTISDIPVTIWPGQSAVFRTGLTFQVPVGYELKVYSRSGHGFKSGIRLSNCTGVLDSDYRGELMVKLHNDSGVPYVVGPQERICQVQLKEAYQHKFVEVYVLSDTSRGTNGFGSTGK